MNILEKVKLAFQVQRAIKVVKKERETNMYDLKIGIGKALRSFVFLSAGVVAAHFAMPENAAELLGMLPENVEHAVAPLLVAFFIFARNWFQNRNGK